MTTIRHIARPGVTGQETTYEVTDDALTWTAGTARAGMPLADIQRVRIFTSPSVRYRFIGNMPFGGLAMCAVQARDGSSLEVSSKHYVSLGVFEDRDATFTPFVDALMQRVAYANPSAVFVAGMPPALWWLWVVVLLITALAALFGVLTVISAATGNGTTVGLLFGLVFTVGASLGLRNTFTIVQQGRQQQFDPRGGIRTA